MSAQSAPTDSNLVGAILSRRYSLKREIGRGGMGTVYDAEQLDDGKRVAVKVLHPYFMADEAVLIRFLEEGRTCMRLVHPNILRVHECRAAEDGSPYLVMDLLEGVPLSAYTKDGGRVALGRAIPILQGMLLGLDAAHKSGVVHRDLKPGNVFLAREGGMFSVKLLDFGIAKVMDAAGGMGTKTRTGALLGTPAYMSPEQVKSAKDVDGRSDLWSVGVMFYEMLSGKVAFPAPTEYARLAAVISAEPAPIESVDPDFSVVAPFLLRALSKDREKRFQTATEMAAALSDSLPPGMTSQREPAPLLFGDSGTSRPRVEFPAPPDSDRSVWSMESEKKAPPTSPAGATPSDKRPTQGSERPKPLSIEVNAPPQLSTLASANRESLTGPPPPTPTPSAAVMVVDDSAPNVSRPTSPGDPALKSQPARGVSIPAVALLVVIALSVGFIAGYMVAMGRWPPV